MNGGGGEIDFPEHEESVIHESIESMSSLVEPIGPR